MKKKIFIGSGISLIAVIAAAVFLFYPSVKFFTEKETIQVDRNLTLMLGGGGNSGIIVGDSAEVVVDTKMMSSSEDLYKLAKADAGAKPIIVINTHFHSDHVNGNKYFKGDRIYIGDYDKEFLKKSISAENQPTDFVKDSLSINIGGEIVHLYNLGQAHTFNDLVVFLENHKVLFTGDLVFNLVNPVLKDESGARVSKWIQVLDIILNRWTNCTFVPGHGKVGGVEIVQAMRQYFVDMTSAAQDPNKQVQMKEKYKDWMKVLNMSSPKKTIEYIKMSEMNK